MIDYSATTVFYIKAQKKRSTFSIIRTTSQSGATVAPAGCYTPCAMDCTLIIFVSGRLPMVLPIMLPVPQKRYDRYAWTERGEVYFSEEAALDQVMEYGTWPRERVRWDGPADVSQPLFTGYTDGTGQR